MEEDIGTEAVKKHVVVLADRLRGQVRITVKEKTWERVDEDLRWAVVLKLTSGEAFNLQGFATVLKRVWRMPKGVRFMEIPGSMGLVKLDSEEKMTRIFDGGPWSFDGAAVLLRRWENGCKTGQLEFTKLRIWVQIHNVPEELLADDAVEEIAEIAGPITKKMPGEREVMRKRYKRFQVEVDIREPLKSGCYVEGRDEMDTWIQFKYERLPNFCKHCGALNHELARCPTGGGERKFGVWIRAESAERWKPPEEEPEEAEDGGRKMAGGR